MVFLLALSPILWLIVSLGVFKMPGFKACPLALVLAFAVALTEYQMAGLDAVTAALEGAALACWPILLVIIAAIFTYNLAVHTKSMDTVLNYRIVSIGRIWSTMSHDKNSVFFA